MLDNFHFQEGIGDSFTRGKENFLHPTIQTDQLGFQITLYISVRSLFIKIISLLLMKNYYDDWESHHLKIPHLF